MNDIEKRILEDYVIKYSVASMSYKMLGMMLDEKYVEERLRAFDIKRMYIYGGNYIGVQLNRVGEQIIDVMGIVDKSRKIAINDNISVLTLDEFRKVYNGEKVIVASLNFFQEIKKDIASFVCKDNIMSIGELLMGITKYN